MDVLGRQQQVNRRADYLHSLAMQEDARAAQAIRAGDGEAAEHAQQRARKLRRIAYLRAAASAYQQNSSLNPEHEQDSETDPNLPHSIDGL